MLRCGDRREWLPVAALVLFAVTLFSALNLSSPLGRELGLMVGGDPGAYLYVGKAWLQGDLPYAGALDNKGPLFHLFNLIGYALHPTYGIWVVGSAVLAVSVVIAYRLARHFLPSGASLGVTALMLASYAAVYQGGNYTEDYALPFILGVLLIAARRWTGGRGAGGCAADQGVPWQGGSAAGRIPRDLIIAGVLGGCVLLIRHNMLAPWILLVGALLVEWRVLGGGVDTKGTAAPRLSGVRRRSLGALLLGGLAAVTPFVLYLVWTGTFAQFIDAYVLFNLRYVDTGADSDRLLFLPWAAASLATLLPAFAAMVLAEVKPPAARGARLFNLYAISSLGAQVLLLAALGTTYWQYLIALVPYVLVGAIAAVTVASRALAQAAAGPAVSRFTTPGWIAVMLLALTVVWAVPSTVTQHQRLLNRSEPRWDLVAAVGDRVQPGERILVLGLHAFVYLETDTLASSRLFYQYPLVAVDSDLRSELLRHIEQSPPRIVVDAGYRPESGVWGQVLGQVGTALRAAGYERIDSATDPRLQPDMTIWVRR